MSTKEIFVYAKNIGLLLKCCPSTSYLKLKAIKRTLGSIPPEELTVDQVCIYYGITLEQYWKTQQRGNKNKPTEGTD